MRGSAPVLHCRPSARARLALLGRFPSHWERALRSYDVVPDHEVALDRVEAGVSAKTVVTATAPSSPGRYRFVAGLVAAAGECRCR